MKSILTLLLLASSLLAYQKGDILTPAMMQTLKMQKNKLYVVDFFASWCGSCKKEMPLIKKVNAQVDTAKVEILGIDVDTKIAHAKAFQKKMAINFRVINDTNNAIIKEFQALGMPSLYYIKDGKVLDIIVGAVHNIDTRLLSDIKKFR
jgi:thiol-disulfide isomerase/thioredoxin